LNYYAGGPDSVRGYRESRLGRAAISGWATPTAAIFGWSIGAEDITSVNYRFSYANLRGSTGLAVQWLAPLGLFRFSYGIPLNPYPGDTVRFNDETERFQFSIGQAF
jgi:outer membrane protein assembly factor BamA